MREITFGTDGWRAVIAEDYTFDNLTRVARATAAWVQQQDAGDGSVVIGYDTRFQGAAFAKHVACVFASAGVRVALANSFATTPAVSWATICCPGSYEYLTLALPSSALFFCSSWFAQIDFEKSSGS